MSKHAFDPDAARSALATLLAQHDGDDGWWSCSCRPDDVLPVTWEEHVADVILTAGWRPPTTLREPAGPMLGGQRQGGQATAATAAELVTPKMGTQREAVLIAIAAGCHGGMGGYTDVETASHTGFPANSVRPRRVELVDAGWVHDSGKRRSHNGRDHVVWTLTQAALERMGWATSR